MANISLRGLEEHIKNILTRQVGIFFRVTVLILNYIYKGVGINPANRSRHHDLDNLAGTWSDSENKEFLDAIRQFEQIDEETWK